ncbi:hypothetical protein MRB53_037724 [Persea americana]|nr:hypothetical protein MRB53_037724 [Persea americana]
MWRWHPRPSNIVISPTAEVWPMSDTGRSRPVPKRQTRVAPGKPRSGVIGNTVLSLTMIGETAFTDTLCLVLAAVSNRSPIYCTTPDAHIVRMRGLVSGWAVLDIVSLSKVNLIARLISKHLGE